MKKILLYIVLAMVSSMAYQSDSHAQNITPDVRAVLNNLQKKYSSDTAISFSVLYKCTGEKRTDLILDSLSGKVLLKGSRFYYEIGGTTTIHTPDYNIMLFKEDKLMYLSNGKVPGAVTPLSMATGLDSIFAQAPGVSARLTDGQEVKTLEIHFPDGVSYKNIRLVIDKKTGFLRSCVYTLKTTSLINAEDGAQTMSKQYEPFSRIESVFSDYKYISSDNGMFNTEQYFLKSGNVFKPSALYSDYMIFKASPNL